jgi:hypothetical protein
VPPQLPASVAERVLGLHLHGDEVRLHGETAC